LAKLAELSKRGVFGFEIFTMGKWWNNNTEIDLVGLNEDSHDIIFGECKYTSNPVDMDVFNNLAYKAKQVQWFNDNRKEHYVIFSRAGFTPGLTELAKERKDLWLFSLG
jgi:AAA+ ATPase superfamily predicted ATPase